MISKYIYCFIIVKNKNSYTNKACKINTGNNPLLFFGLSGISVVFPVIRVFLVSLGTPSIWSPSLTVVFFSFFFSFYRYWFAQLEYYTRECKFGNFDKKNNTKNKTTQKEHKNFWLNFCLNKECPKLLCGLGVGHRRRQTIPMWNSLGEKGILQGITVCLLSAVLSTM